MEDFSLSVEDCSQILNNRFKNPFIKPTRSEMSKYSEEVKGLMGNHFKLIIYYDIDDREHSEQFFVKTIQKHRPETQNGYNKEIFFYSFLVKEFKKLGLDASFAPECYFCKGSETLVLQDLTINGFNMPERKQFYDLEQLKSCLDSVASFHGYSFVYELERSKELGRDYRLIDDHKEVFEELFFDRTPNTVPYLWYEASISLWTQLIDEYFGYEDYKEEFKRLIKETNLRDVFYEDAGYRKTCGHGDLWSNNMMFKRLKTGKLKQIIIDYQVIRYFYPAYDILLLIYYNTTREIRKALLNELLDYYYLRVSAILSKKGYDISEVLPLEDFQKSIPLVEYQVIFQITAGYSVINLPTDMLNKIPTEYQEFMFKDRYHLVKEAMEKDKAYKDTIMECIMDLKEYLFKK